MGKILVADLSSLNLRDEVPDEAFNRDYIGGCGVGARYIFNNQKAGIDPLGPDNILGFIPGPLSGTRAISGTRYVIVGKSPLTGTWGDANSGGYFSAYLKFSGYDGVFVNGISDKPVYIFIDNGRAELRDAVHLWGKDCYDTEDILKAEHGSDIAVACIGPSGETRSLIAGIVHSKGSVAGRSGLGALMGSKRLKAVAVKGTMKVPVADDQKVKDLRKKYQPLLAGHIDMMRKHGTNFVNVISVETGDSPVKNWGGTNVVDFPDPQPLGYEPIYERQLKRAACYQCAVGCEAVMKKGTGEYEYVEGTYRPEYETVAMYGSNLLNNNLESIIKANDLCNRYGIDTISAGATVAFAIECFENGILNKKDTDGLEMTWGNHRAIVALTKKIGRREGIGAILADGVKSASEHIGRGAEKFAIHIQGQEVPAHHPIVHPEFVTNYAGDATPGRHTLGSEEMHPPGFMPDFDHQSNKGRGPLHKKGINIQHALSCCGMCLFVYIVLPSVEVIPEFMRAVTGWDITTDELLVTGERIANMRQAFNIREGLNQRQFEVPGRILGKPLYKEGPIANKTVDLDTLVDGYYTAMDWDLKTGKPSRKKLLELGLGDVVQVLYP